jgi:hypothetical protein
VRRALPIAAVLLALVAASCGDDDDEGGNGNGGGNQPLFTAQEVAPTVERTIVRRAKVEERAAGNDPADYTYEARCIPKSELVLNCRLDLTDKSGETINTVAYRANVDPDTGEFGYTVTANRDTRPPAGG